MASEEHLAILKQGVDVWNAWVKECCEQGPSFKADLSWAKLCGARLGGAQLSEADLSRVNLNGADLSWADLIEANLTEAQLRRADLSLADLSKAKLRGADLTGAHMSGTNLEEAYLRRANLCLANLMEARLREADLSGAHLGGANLSGTDLRGAYLSRANLNMANLGEADLRGANLSVASLRGANLGMASLRGANLRGADLTKADMSTVDLRGANLRGVRLTGAHMVEANLREADLTEADLSAVDLSGTDLTLTTLVRTSFERAILVNCRVYGISAWDLRLKKSVQDGLIITPFDQPAITIDNLGVAQFIYLLLNNAQIRDVIDTITTKVVLILGRFTPERKPILDAIRNALRQRNYLPVLFDFDKPASRDTHETITTLARLARFVIADITDPKSIPQELVDIVQHLPSVPVKPLLQAEHEPWGMYDHIRRYPWVLPLHRYHQLADLLLALQDDIIGPAERKAMEQRPE